MNPSTGEIIEINGYHVYRSTEFTSDMEAQDVFVNPYSVEKHKETLQAMEQLIEESEVI